ncbi:hypothetical protein BCR36DRAFT_586098 [Piromyces finnis]|uniref:Uncharacterized protein n=1 Tax=Piromyces finnis TaxID=1754191 RepID=A0A1Y1V1F8_9FUNG|nr:hypothetical protein BCR36DRAFT_586098 [Piromyces finnis]|eukprot:ORX44475.1 hypothetical protein BCR36DRAFT_586098 [Piromyces finnis]
MNTQLLSGNIVKNTFVSLLQSSLPSISKLSLSNVNITQRRNKSSNLDKDMAQNIFFSQHRPVLFNDIKYELEIKSLQNERKSILEPVPFSSSIPKQCKSYNEMKYNTQEIYDEKSEEEKSQILAAWDILDCMFTGRTNSSNNAYTKEEDTSNKNSTPQPLKSICEDTFLSCVNNSLSQQEEDDIDIDILFHQLFKNNLSNSSKNSSSSSNTSANINSKDTTLKK